jgi:AcrR family transcriptional regulator
MPAERDEVQSTDLPLVGGRRERADAAANRTRILEAASRVLAERGADAISLDAVAEAAEVGKGTVFRRFGDRSGLFQALMDEHLRTLQDAFMLGPPPLGPGAPPRERLVAFFDAYVDFLGDHLEVALALERDRWKTPIGGFMVLSLHIANLLGELNPELDRFVAANLLLGSVNVNEVRFLLDNGVELSQIKASMRAIVGGLAAGA